MKTLKFSEAFQGAINDYFMLLEKGYPEKAVLQMVATRFGLSGKERSILFRGVFRQQESGNRSNRLIPPAQVKGAILAVDCLNQVLTIAGYLKGNLVFRATDKIVRDASEFHSRLPVAALLKRSVDAMILTLERLAPLHTDFFIDQQVNRHDEIASMIRFESFEEWFPFQVILSDQVDQKIRNFDQGIICSSDTRIIDACKCSVFDLALNVINDHFEANIPDIHLLLKKKQ